MRLRPLLALGLGALALTGGIALVAAGGGVATDGERPSPVQAGDEGIGVETDVPIPRVCWFSDYEGDPPGLANQCRFDRARQVWLIEVDGAWKRAKGRRLPTANLCHYFAGRKCPKG